MKTVLVTGIGGNVGQGILRNIIALEQDIRLVGTNTETISAGNHLCHEVYQVPFSSDTKFIPSMISICTTESVDLIIPSTDYETYYLSSAKDQLPAIACSDAAVSKVFLNKYETWLAFKAHGLPFADSALPSEYNGEFDRIIVKPAEGRGSRNLNINPTTWSQYSDDYIVQKLYQGIEITTAFYVTKKVELHGFITFQRSLTAGTTSSCEVNTDFDNQLKHILNNIISVFPIKGSCNLQSIVTDDNQIHPFEVNCRISGTNSIRSNFGFEDVKYTIQEYLFNTEPSPPHITQGAAVRIYMDVIYPDLKLNEINNKSTKHYIF